MQHPTIEPPGVFIWWIMLDQQDSCDVLSEAEHLRACRFHFEQDRRRYISARSALRLLLGHYIGVDPRTLVFAVGEHGKPYLESHRNIHFNLTHSGPLAGLAISTHGAVGLDCEYIHEMEEMTSISERVCSEDELRIMSGVSVKQYRELFFRSWTRKESILKAIGLGLGFSLRSLTAITLPDTARLNVEVPGHGSWWVATVNAPPGYAASCCTPLPVATSPRFLSTKLI